MIFITGQSTITYLATLQIATTTTNFLEPLNCTMAYQKKDRYPGYIRLWQGHRRTDARARPGASREQASVWLVRTNPTTDLLLLRKKRTRLTNQQAPIFVRSPRFPIKKSSSITMTETNGKNGSNGNGTRVGTLRVKQGLAQMLKGGVIVSRRSRLCVLYRERSRKWI